MNKKKILILGSNGFFGKTLKNLFTLENENENEKHDLLFIEKKDINLLEKKDLNDYMKIHKPEIVINCCGIIGSSEFNKDNDQLTILNENLILNINILDCCRENNIYKLFVFSTYRLINDTYILNENINTVTYNESNIHQYFSFKPDGKNIGYLLSKQIMDMQIKLLNKTSNTKVICLILPNVFGKFDNFFSYGRIIPSLLFKFKNAQKENEDIIMNCSRKIQINLIYVNDIFNIIKKSIDNETINGNILVFNPKGTLNLHELTQNIKSLINFQHNIFFKSDNESENESESDNNMLIPDTSNFEKLFPDFIFSDVNSSLLEIINYYFS
jgi:nucleoside-diphosphate-sugar epimerase